MLEIHFRQLHIALVDHSLKAKSDHANLKKHEIQDRYTKTCFQHDMNYGDFKDLRRRTAADNVLCDQAFSTAKNPKYDGYQRGLALMVYNSFP